MRHLLLVILALAWIAGILTDSVLPIPPQPCLLLSSLTCLLLIIFWHNQPHRLLLLLLLCMTLGAWRYAQGQPQNDPQSVYKLINTPSPLGIRGTVTDEPKLQTRTRTLTISVNRVQNSGSSQWENADGTIEVTTLFQGPSPEDPYGANYGDSIELQGKLQSPTPTSPKNVIPILRNVPVQLC